MRWHELKDVLKDYPVELLREQDGNVKLYSLMYLAPILKDFSKNILYIGTYQDFLHLTLPADGEISAVLYGDEAPDAESISPQVHNLAWINQMEKYQECANILQSFFAEFLLMDDWLKGMYNQMHKGVSLTDITNIIAQKYQRPVNVVDTSYSIIAQSDNFAEYDQKLTADQVRGYIPPDIIKNINIRAK